MGFKDRLSRLRESISLSPVDVTLIEQGNAVQMRAGEPATVNVKVKGEADETVDRIELNLHRGSEPLAKLAEVPQTPGVHAVAVQLPTGLAPSVAGLTDYTLRATVKRNKGLENEGTLPIDVIARPEDIRWPDGPRHGQDGPGPVTIDVDAEVVASGSAFTGRASGVARLVLGSVFTRAGGDPEKFVEAAGADVAPDGTFSITVPEASRPTLDLNGTTIVWRLQARTDTTTAWRTVAVVDPNGDAGIRARTPTSIASAFASGSPQ